VRSAVEAPRLTALRAPAVVAAVAVASVAYLAAVDPHEGGHYPTCPSLLITGWYCPGCGSLRAIHDLAHGDLMGALGMNILAVVAIPWLVWRWWGWTAGAAGRPAAGRLVARKPAPAWAIYALAVAIVLYWVARNIPSLAPYLAP